MAQATEEGYSLILKENEALKAKLRQFELLTIDKVKTELFSLKCISGKDEAKCALKRIEWESDLTFTNGYKAPPWRQQFGELGYILVRAFDAESVIVTASEKGYFINKGYMSDDKGEMQINYERVGDIYGSLMELLKAFSPHFRQIISGSYKVDDDSDSSDEKAAGGKGKDRGDAAAAGGKEGRAGAESAGPAGPGGSSPSGATANSGKANANSPGGKDKDSSHEDGKDEEDRGRDWSRNDDRKTALAAKRRLKGGKDGKKTRVMDPSSKWKQISPAHEVDSAKKRRKAERSAEGLAPSMKVPEALLRSDRAMTVNESPTRAHRHQSIIDDSDTESEVSSEEEMQDKRQEAEAPPEQWQIQKLVKYLRAGNQTATIIAICSLRDYDLLVETNQLAIRNVGGLEILVNLLDTDDPKCKIGSLKILKDISHNYQIRNAIGDLDGMHPLVELLRDSSVDIKCLAAETIAHCARNARNRRAVRRYGGIKKLVKLLKTDGDSPDNERVAISGALALCSCSRSSKNKEAIRTAGSIPLLAELLKSQDEKLLIPVVGILQECASDENYRIAIRSSGMIKFLVDNLASKSEELQTHSASAIFKCAEDIRQFNGLTPLVNLLDNVANKELLSAATGAVWKCAQDLENVDAFNKLNTIKKLVGLMDNQPEDVLVNAVGALGACAKTAEGRQALRECNGITPLVNLLTGTNQALLVNVTTAIGACALDSDSMATIDRLDGVRLLWSLLKSPNPQVQASAAWAICPCIEHAKDAGEMVRSFVGGLELIVSLLKSENVEVLASVCAAIANISKDEENLAVITDHGVVPMLAKLTTTRHDRLRKHLAEAIARCCHWGNNKIAFGTANAVAPLVKYLKSPDEEVHRSTARALHQLSMDPDNCVMMHEHGVVQLLLSMVGSSDPALQEAAAGTIGNIRRLALASEKAALV
ncbi:hypothetical protein RI367_003728 [Sorochytrium milnesiophthora]